MPVQPAGVALVAFPRGLLLARLRYFRGPPALPYSTAGPLAAAPASAAVTLCFAASQHPSLSSPICLMLLGPPFYKMGRKTVSSCLCSVLF